MSQAPERHPVDHPPADQRRTRWWFELLLVAVFYFVYSVVRSLFGSSLVKDAQIPVEAFLNAIRIIRIERALGLFHEETIQDWVLPHRGVVLAFNTYYGVAHFVVTGAVFVALYLLRPTVFRLWRTCLAATTALAIIGFALFPLMPPRLLDQSCPPVEFGGACIMHELRNYNDARHFGFVDTIDVVGGPWAFDEGPGLHLSNQYAAMPSLHVAWALWCTLALYPVVRRRWLRVGLVAHPIITMVCIIVTGNHFWLDGVGGVGVLGAGYWVATKIHQRLDRTRFIGHTESARL